MSVCSNGGFDDVVVIVDIAVAGCAVALCRQKRRHLAGTGRTSYTEGARPVATLPLRLGPCHVWGLAVENPPDDQVEDVAVEDEPDKGPDVLRAHPDIRLPRDRRVGDSQ